MNKKLYFFSTEAQDIINSEDPVRTVDINAVCEKIGINNCTKKELEEQFEKLNEQASFLSVC